MEYGNHLKYNTLWQIYKSNFWMWVIEYSFEIGTMVLMAGCHRICHISIYKHITFHVKKLTLHNETIFFKETNIMKYEVGGLPNTNTNKQEKRLGSISYQLQSYIHSRNH